MAPRNIPALLAGQRPSVSFEFFPPKDDVSEAALWDAIRRLERVRPDFVSVTYGAGGSTQDRTVRVTERIARETTLTPLAHLTCVGASVEDIRRVVGQYAAAGVRNILALRGDPPGDPGGEWVAHPEGLDHATDLVGLVRTLGNFTIGVAAFPDVHPASRDLDQDVEVLVKKADAGASFAVTQMVFDADTYLRLRDRVAQHRDLPITPGLMPVTNLKQITRMTQLMGTPLPQRVLGRLEAVAGDADAVRAVGVEIATELAQRMLSEGAPGLHFITMNRSTATLEVYQNLGLAAGAR
ncbi:5,10-methylenetetrahydrofolate reductase [Knoellia sinensis KCTC 19936]|uniref:Methylenetetrahydrofolate reductase n=1 Tax=Knoellia sinensis KCTC 19936 TaxID=1385520 RepID=A0A0A0JC45_9MICO|nr:methylenetetrahydrofolate reductase [NAD(P)H] [Knoellia sinensis]KGN33206.1 5,10-methylenetetrahydrofolate reductase [Knoellia sinensis KCTC 19936]